MIIVKARAIIEDDPEDQQFIMAEMRQMMFVDFLN